jgi:hypothetical protein
MTASPMGAVQDSKGTPYCPQNKRRKIVKIKK